MMMNWGPEIHPDLYQTTENEVVGPNVIVTQLARLKAV